MHKANVLKYLKALGVTAPQGQPRPQWVVSACPLGPWRHDGGKSHDEAFGVRMLDEDAGDAFTNCFSCGWHGSQQDLIMRMKKLNAETPAGDFDFKTARMLVEEAEEKAELRLDAPDIDEILYGANTSKFHEYPQWWIDSYVPWSAAQPAREYLIDRGVSDGVADFMDLRYDSAQNRLCFPVRDFAHRLGGLHGRAMDDAVEPRYRMYLQAKRNNPILWLGESTVDLTRPVVFVEGPFDMASVLRVYRNVACPLFANPSTEKLRRMADATDIITFYDLGKGGDSGRDKVSDTMVDAMVTHMKPQGLAVKGGKTLDRPAKDPGEMSIAELVDVLQDVVPMDEIWA